VERKKKGLLKEVGSSGKGVFKVEKVVNIFGGRKGKLFNREARRNKERVCLEGETVIASKRGKNIGASQGGGKEYVRGGGK